MIGWDRELVSHPSCARRGKQAFLLRLTDHSPCPPRQGMTKKTVETTGFEHETHNSSRRSLLF
ncbi:hypothetical protein RESH_04360 [Rhodopirellula europaea SH398]|uniref:Uncharacterized protein n=1 Tax=Rhodopirellula europaea SH398 TaxID=1263868 RepID=M5SBL6_9BACT|nr:hypothetical protein RESH_04360 [Rhodopirellula europaea SH398]